METLPVGHTASPRARVRPIGLWQGELTAGWVALILAGHGVYGLLLARSVALATLHALLTFAIGLWFAATSTMRRVSIVCAYMAGSEILWRVGRAELPWEFVKYAIVLLCLINLGRVRNLRWDWLAVSYFAVLLPSTIIAFSEHDFDFARKQVSFNLSGPLLLCVGTWFFACQRPSRAEIQRLILAAMAPIVSLGFIVLTKTASLDDLAFSDQSNFQTSGGFGPNQVSTVLGLGVILALLAAFMIERSFRSRILYGGVAIFTGALSALTFSRGGLAAALGALVIASPFLLHGSRNRVALLIGAAALVFTVDYFVVPRLDAFTGGAILTRFEDTSPTGRDELVRTELDMFESNPVFGVGPAVLDPDGDRLIAAHTEFSRLPAQHGVFGIAAILLMIAIAWRDVASQRNAVGRAMAVALISWSVLTMFHAAMRLAAAPFIFGLAAALFLSSAPSNAEWLSV